MANRIPESTSVEAKLTRWLYMKDVVVIFTVFVIVLVNGVLNKGPSRKKNKWANRQKRFLLISSFFFFDCFAPGLEILS